MLITGGTGGLGRVLAGHLVARGQRHIVLAGRSGSAVVDLPGVRVVACDVTDAAAVRALVDGLEPPLTAVVHAAGVLDDGIIDQLSPERLDTVLRPKVDGAWHLHEATLHHDLAAFVLYSSVAGVIGGAGQGNYAAGNAYLDALASYRSGLGLPATSIAWGPWQDQGMTTGAPPRTAGFQPIPVERGLAMFDTAVRLPDSMVVPVLIQPGDGRAPVPPVFRDLVGGGRRSAAGPTRPGGAAEQVAALHPDQRLQFLVELVRTEVAAVLGHTSADAIEADRDFQALGFDSLTAVELRNRLGAAAGLRMPATMVFDYATPQRLAEFLLGELAPEEQPVAGDSVLADLDRLEATLAVAALDEQARSGVAARLHRLLDQWRPDTGEDADTVARQLEAAGRDEIFDFIDHELGRLRSR